MAKKATRSTSAQTETSAASGAAASKPASSAKKASTPRVPKHVKVQAAAVAAAVENFVTAIVSPSGHAEKAPEVAATPAPAPTPDSEVETVTQEPAPVEAPKQEVTHEQISRLAYQFYLERGGQGGSPAEDWLRAEQTLSSSAS